MSSSKVLFLSCVASGERGALANQDRERADARRREGLPEVETSTNEVLTIEHGVAGGGCLGSVNFW